LAKNSSVRVPKLYAAFASQDVDLDSLITPDEAQTASVGDDKKKATCYYFITEYIEGCSLGAILHELEESVGPPTRKAAKLVGEQLRKLRSVPAEDPELYGRVGGRPFPMTRSFWCPPAPHFNDYGPFDYETLVNRLDHSGKIQLIMSEAACKPEYRPWMKMLYQEAKSALIDNLDANDRLPVLSHLDLKPDNIVVKYVRNEAGKIVDITDLVIVDWESMCWMPAWFEAAAFRNFAQSPSGFYQVFGLGGLEAMGHISIVPILFYAYCADWYLLGLN
jgi:hypothetical protein